MARRVPFSGQSFPFHHGRLALSFIGTVGDRGSLRTERLPQPAALGQWLFEANLIVTPLVPAVRTYRSALELRDTIERIVVAIVAAATPATGDIEALNSFMRRWHSRPQLDPLTLSIGDGAADPINAALGRIARDAIEVVGTPAERARLRTCGISECGSIFLTPVGHERRWCSMERCGNRAKVAAFRARRSDQVPFSAPK